MTPTHVPSALKLIALAFAAALAPPAAHADELTVPGDHATIQEAIDAAAVLDVIVVTGGVSAPIVIDKPLFIVGSASDRPRIRPALPGEETLPFTQDPAVTITAFGTGTVTLSNLDIGGEVDGSYFGAPGAGVQGSGFEELRLIQCDIAAAEWINPGGLGQAAHAVVLSGVPVLLVSDSSIQGGTGTYDVPFPFPMPLPNGGTGLLVSDAEVTVLDSEVRGGSGLDMVFDGQGYCPATCAEIGAGKGGVAIVADEVFHAASIMQAGPGATLECSANPGPATLICTKAAGAAIENAAEVVGLPGLFLGSGPLLEGGSTTLTWSTESSSVLLLYSTAPIPPLALGSKGLLFLQPGLLFALPVPGGPLVSASFSIPTSTGATGLPIGFQIYDPATGLSRPVISTVVPH